MNTGRNLTGLKISVDIPEGMSVASGSYEVNGQRISTSAASPTKASVSGHEIGIWVDIASSGREMTFYLSDVPVGFSLPDIVFRTALDSEVKNNQTFSLTAAISGDGDKREHTEKNGNMATVTVSAIALGSSGLKMSSVSSLVERNGVTTYTIFDENTGKTPIETMYLYDILPHDRDNRGSSFSGSLTLVDARSVGIPEADVEFYVSKLAVSKLEPMISGFINPKAVLNDPAVFTRLDTATDRTGITCVYAVVKNLAAGSTFTMQLDVEMDGNAGEDVYQNDAQVCHVVSGTPTQLRSNRTEVHVVSRSAAGQAWMDKNRDGKFDPDEYGVEGIFVKLLQQQAGGEYAPYLLPDNTEAAIYVGNAMDVITGETSSAKDTWYRFYGLPEGMYGISFTGNLEWYETESAVLKFYDDQERLTETRIEGIEMPSIKDRISGPTALSTF